MGNRNTCVHVRYELETRNGLRAQLLDLRKEVGSDSRVAGSREMGVRTPLPSERNRDLDFSILNKEALGWPSWF